MMLHTVSGTCGPERVCSLPFRVAHGLQCLHGPSCEVHGQEWLMDRGRQVGVRGVGKWGEHCILSTGNYKTVEPHCDSVLFFICNPAGNSDGRWLRFN